MWAFLTSLWNGFLGFLSLLLPFAKDSPWRRMSSPVRWFLHFFLLALIVVGLYFLNSIIESKVVVSWARHVWLPVFFLLVYLLLWTGWWVWKLLMAESEPSSFPDIDAAWEEAVRTLNQAGISLTSVPLFLVLGRPAAPEAHFFSAAQLQLDVQQTPAGPQAPLHVYANRKAIFVTCPGASLLGKHAANIALETIEELGSGGGGEEDGPGVDQTIRPGGKVKKVMERWRNIGGPPRNLVERRADRRALDFPMPDLLKNSGEVEMLRARLAHLGRLIVRDREPLCPINGVLVMIPVGGTDTAEDAQQTAELCSRDLATLRHVLKLQCPVFALCCDLEALTGFADFVQRVPPKDRLGRLGQRFPLASPDLHGEALEKHIAESIHHLCNNYLRDWVYRLFRADGGEARQGTVGNTGLYLFLDEMRCRKQHLSRILTQGIAREAPSPLLFGGCYLAATGADKEREQAFVPGVVKRLFETQDFVSWTHQAFAEDRRAHGRATVGYVLLSGLALVPLAILGYMLFFGHRGM